MDDRATLGSALSGRYELDREIGRGGMATVYLARDLRHDRLVALKLLDPELGAVLGKDRFLTEIRVTANLQHPNVLPLFDSGEAGGMLFYVMPYVEGESLRHRLAREKQLPIETAVRIAIAILAALEHAHRKGIVHRDLKPENILLLDGQPLLADFGIALAVANAGGSRVTQTGLSLGTPQYMSPEQATGDRGVDARSDIYSLGAVLYEMLAGDPPHAASTAQAVIAKVVTEPARDVRLARPNVAPHVAAAIARALEKLPADRFATAEEFATTLAQSPARGTSESLTRTSNAPTRNRLAVALAALALVVAAGSAIGWWRATHRTIDRVPTRFVVSLDSLTLPNLASATGVAISPDGNTIAFLANEHANGAPRVYIQRLSELSAHPVAGTDGTRAVFWSPDGKSLGLQQGTQVKRMDAGGGTASVIADIGGPFFGASWNERGEIVGSEAVTRTDLLLIAPGQPVRRIAVDSALRSAAALQYPLWIPGATNTFLCSVLRGGPTGMGEFFAIDARSGKATYTGLNGIRPIGFVDDILLYQSDQGAILAVHFDMRNFKPIGQSVDAVDAVSGQTQIGSGTSASLSASGTFVYVTGVSNAQLVAVGDKVRSTDRVLIPTPGGYSEPRWSPDGKRVAMAVAHGGRTDVWVLDTESGALSRLTTEAATNDRPEWSADGSHVIFRANVKGSAHLALYWQRADGSERATPLYADPGRDIWQGSLLRDGHTVVYRTGTLQSADVWVADIASHDPPRPLLNSPFTEMEPRVSPDEKWIAYTSNETGQNEVYIRAFPSGANRVQVSVDGGSQPVWSRDGRHLYFVRDTTIADAALEFGASARVLKRTVRAGGMVVFTNGHAGYDVGPDGSLVVPKHGRNDARMIVIRDWQSELLNRLTHEGHR